MTVASAVSRLFMRRTASVRSFANSRPSKIMRNAARHSCFDARPLPVRPSTSVFLASEITTSIAMLAAPTASAAASWLRSREPAAAAHRDATHRCAGRVRPLRRSRQQRAELPRLRVSQSDATRSRQSSGAVMPPAIDVRRSISGPDHLWSARAAQFRPVAQTHANRVWAGRPDRVSRASSGTRGISHRRAHRRARHR